METRTASEPEAISLPAQTESTQPIQAGATPDVEDQPPLEILDVDALDPLRVARRIAWLFASGDDVAFASALLEVAPPALRQRAEDEERERVRVALERRAERPALAPILGELIRWWVAALRLDLGTLRELLEGRGHPLSVQRGRAWLAGELVPSVTGWATLLDVFVVTNRPRWLRAREDLATARELLAELTAPRTAEAEAGAAAGVEEWAAWLASVGGAEAVLGWEPPAVEPDLGGSTWIALLDAEGGLAGHGSTPAEALRAVHGWSLAVCSDPVRADDSCEAPAPGTPIAELLERAHLLQVRGSAEGVERLRRARVVG